MVGRLSLAAGDAIDVKSGFELFVIAVDIYAAMNHLRPCTFQ